MQELTEINLAIRHLAPGGSVNPPGQCPRRGAASRGRPAQPLRVTWGLGWGATHSVPGPGDSADRGAGEAAGSRTRLCNHPPLHFQSTRPVCAQSDCDPVGCSPPGSSVHGIFQERNTAVGCRFLLQGCHTGRVPQRWEVPQHDSGPPGLLYPKTLVY